MNPATPPTAAGNLELQTEAASGTARATLWWTDVPPMTGERVGVIGGFSATSREATQELMDRAFATLCKHECTLAIGPMDGSPWRRYRFVTDAGTEPPFFLEPSNPPEWPEWWQATGFSPLAEYYSAATRDLAVIDERLGALAGRMAAAGVVIRAINPAHFADEMRRIYDVSLVSFRNNFLYAPLTWDAFIAQYGAIWTRLQPELVLLAEQAGRPVGYAFAMPDYAQAARGVPLTAFVLKTLAVLPGRAYAGLGTLLGEEVNAAARRLGFSRAIHALMHETNKSRNLSAHSAQRIRRYTLFARRLAP